MWNGIILRNIRGRQDKAGIEDELFERTTTEIDSDNLRIGNAKELRCFQRLDVLEQ